MTDTMQELTAIHDAITIIDQAKRETMNGIPCVFDTVYHAKRHLNDRAKELLFT